HLTPSFLLPRPSEPTSTLFPYTTLFRSDRAIAELDRAISGHQARKTAPDGDQVEISIGQPRQADEPSSGGSPSSQSWPRIARRRSEEHTSELQSQSKLVCRLLLGQKNKD